ncbi:trypsin-like [Eurosta solidaginis]|uniref:trypsin-like n=1 Tax=Eurosta solidaginis TaxID=178769 RepID=UPI0035311D62
MNIANHFSLLFVLLSCVWTHTNARFRIIGGQYINIESSPHTVAIVGNRNYYYCVGSIVNYHSVLTAAHSVKNEILANLKVLAGVSEIRSTFKGEGQRHKVENIHYDPDYDPETLFMDIAVVKVITPFDLNSAVKIIPLCDIPAATDSDMEISGWGGTVINSDICSPLLKSKIVKIADGQQCRDPISNTLLSADYAETIMFAGRSGEGICFGDSGAGGVVNGKLCAVAQGGFEEPDYPDLYTNITNPKVREFITRWM